ncbi:AMP-dependent synthetase [Rhodococcus sp. AD45-ID]|uniref:AMP-binding protein n=1 Tax=unclassified Rhodococcus (in: high G+C Gram-positive bacteria) TaxID=192944 RepID=UPI0005D33938|nr:MULTISPECIES: AMP-binding protein [unclassified Rhodococcus (in: high G+C Gram-positive bacteria)]KJF24446.1 Long-chain-fatty-acid--CoA ligase [Rhodococcus sp. AD45]PSR42744.1 AMP-dependent synthetase [Rhodococcus sp. AD45-ID]
MVSVLDPVTRYAAATPDNIAIRGSGRDWTYRQLHDASLSFGGRIRAAGLSEGDRVLLAAPSVAEFIVAYMGIQAAGCVVVPVNTMSAQPEIEYVLDDADISLAIAWHQLGPATHDAGAARGVPVWTLTEESARTDQEPTAIADRDVHDTTAILYTSGTTGRPKGAQLTVGLSAGEIGAESSRGNSSDRTGTGLPLFHIFGQGSVMMATFTGGGSLSLLPRFDPTAMLDLVRKDKLTIMAGVPTMWNAMLHAAADVDSSDFEQLRIAISGGASLPGEVARAFETRFACTILEGYGLTETSAFGTFNSIDRPPKIGYTGRAVPRTEVEVRDHDGNHCPAGTVGEVFIKGPTVMKGYWKRPDDTSAVLSPDGWFRTGDLGETDADGDLRIVDRVKDLIIRGGYNVYPGEVEEVLYQHPDIIEAAVIGIPDDYYGEEVAAVVAVRSGSVVDAADVTAWARERLSAYKIPRVVQFIDALPKGSTGKILKRSIDRTGLVTLKQS